MKRMASAVGALSWRAALVLAACAGLAALAIVATHAVTLERIAQQAQDAQRKAITAVLDGVAFDNDPLADGVLLRAPRWLGSDAPLPAWRARRNGVLSAVVLDVVAPGGYGGPIALRIGIDADGRVLVVHTLAHRETPGLGDAIDAGKSDWMHQFTGRGLNAPPRERWRVRRDGGDFDQIAGATITPRAVVGAVRHALDYFAVHRADLDDARPGAVLEHDDAPSD